MAQRTRHPFRSPAFFLGWITLVALAGAGCRSEQVVTAAVPAAPAGDRVRLVKTPDGGIQPQAMVDDRGAVHLVYLKGPAGAADIFYRRQDPGSDRWPEPLRVNSRPGAAVATGTIRGAQLAVGKGGRVHVVWFGSAAMPRGPDNSAPLLYSRLDDAGSAFEPERNLMQFTSALDGGPSVAADAAGNVYVAWHGQDGSSKGEASRRAWIARSQDEGKSFSREAPAFGEPTGACACCGAKAFADRQGALYFLYRAATGGTERDMVLLTSRDRGQTFQGRRIHPWRINSCPMSSESFAASPAGVLAAWETSGQVYFARINPATGYAGPPIAAPGAGGSRKHPALATNARGETLLAWTEGTGWERGGALAWQRFDARDQPIGPASTLPDAIPVWGLATAFARPDGSFVIVH
jgi:hypothetical protein